MFSASSMVRLRTLVLGASSAVTDRYHRGGGMSSSRGTNGAGPCLSQATERPPAAPEMLNDEFFQVAAKPLAFAHRILASVERTELEEAAINAVSIFARGVVSLHPKIEYSTP